MNSLEVATRRENSYPTSRDRKKKNRGNHNYLNEGEIKEKKERFRKQQQEGNPKQSN